MIPSDSLSEHIIFDNFLNINTSSPPYYFLSPATKTVRIPEVFHYGELPGPPSGGALRGNGSFIIMENLNMRGAADPAELGKQLALMHLAEPSVSPQTILYKKNTVVLRT